MAGVFHGAMFFTIFRQRIRVRRRSLSDDISDSQSRAGMSEGGRRTRRVCVALFQYILNTKKAQQTDIAEGNMLDQMVIKSM